MMVWRKTSIQTNFDCCALKHENKLKCNDLVVLQINKNENIFCSLQRQIDYISVQLAVVQKLF